MSKRPLVQPLLTSLFASAVPDCEIKHQRLAPNVRPLDPAAVPLPTPSAEQQGILHSLLAGHCVLCEALAGTGKTTTCLLAIAFLMHQYAHLVLPWAIVITFGRALTDDCKDRLKSHGLGHLARAATFHSIFGQQLGGARVCDNTDLSRRVKAWRRGIGLPRRLNERLIILDELQDLCPLIFEALTFILPEDAILLVLGDKKQLLYLFRKGDERGTAAYLEEAPTVFAPYSKGRHWDVRHLTVSYRLTPHVAAFANEVWGTQIVAASTKPNRPVEYWYVDPWDTNGGVSKRLAAVIDEALASGLRMEDVWILAQSVKTSRSGKQTPLEKVLNNLQEMEDDDGRRKYNFLISSTDNDASSRMAENKVRVSTFCSSKGGEAPVVIVWGMSMYDTIQATELRNQLGVALSRSSGRLIVIHTRGSDMYPVDYYPPLSQDLLHQLGEAGVVECPDGLPPSMKVGSTMREETLWASDIATQLCASEIDTLMEPFEWTHDSINDGYGQIEVQTTRQFHTGARKTTEPVGHLYGIAVPFALEERRTGVIGDVCEVLCAIRLHAKNRYSWTFVDEMLLHNGNHDIDVSGDLPRKLQMGFTRIAGGAKTISGKELIPLLRSFRLRRMSDQTPIGVCDSSKYDEIFQRYINDLKTVYKAEDRTRHDRYMLLANARQAYGGSHHLFHQIGTDLKKYEWVESGRFEEALERLDAMMPSDGIAFEHVEVGTLPLPLVDGNRKYVEIGAKMDGVAPGVVYENKFCKDEINDEHKMQALVGACLVALRGGREVMCVVNGFRRGERAVTRVCPEAAATLLQHVAEAW